MIKYSKWIGLAAALVLAIACFMPWTFHADVNKNFTGFFSQDNAYGKPGKFLLILAAVIVACYFISRLWLKRASIFLGSINFAYALKSFLVYSSCYSAYCPEKKPGLWLMLFSTVIMLVATAFPDMKLKETETSEGQSVNQETPVPDSK